jgi:O-antigen ligase
MFMDVQGRQIVGGGSNIEMRSIQTATVLSYIEDTPLFGRGVHYFNKDLGWGEGGFKTLKDSRLYGIEGVYMKYLLERGFVGYFLYLLICFFLLFYIVRHRSTNKRLTGLGISVFVLYTLFAHMTGELGSVFPTLLVLGCIIGTIENRNKLNT